DDVAKADEYLDQCRPDLRRWEWHYLKRLCHPELLVVAAPGARDVAFGPDGARIVVAGRSLAIRDAATGRLIRSLGEHPETLGIALGPDGPRLAAAVGGGTIAVWDLAAEQGPLTIHWPDQGWVGRPAFSPDGRRIAAGSQKGGIAVWDAATGEPLRMLRGHADS